jgi:hypothetical protein
MKHLATIQSDQQRQRRQRGGLSGLLYGPGATTTHYRFIPAVSIVDVVKRHD